MGFYLGYALSLYGRTQDRLSHVLVSSPYESRAYYGLTGNSKRLSWFRYQVARIWRMWLARRSRLRRLNWDRMNELLKRYPLPPATITRSWQRFLSEPVR